MTFLKIKPRLSISILLFLLALFVLCTAYTQSISTNIAGTELEGQGVAYLRPLMNAMDNVAYHYSLKLRLEAGDASARAKLKIVADATSKAFDDLKDADTRLAESLQLTNRALKDHHRENLDASALQSQWQAIAGSDPNRVTRAQYNQLLDALKEKAAYVGDTSTLILDPDMDSYYLMHAMVISMPDTMAHVARGESLATVAFDRLPSDNGQKTNIGTLATLLEDIDITHTGSDMQSSYNEDPNHYGVSPTLKPNTQDKLAEYYSTNQTFAKTLRGLAGGSAPIVPTVMEQAEAAQKANHELWDASAQELDVLLHTRIAHFENQRNIALMKTLLPVLLALAFFVYISHGIIVSLKKLETAMSAISEGALDYAVPCQDMQDEIGSMARTLEKFRKSYWWLDSR